MEISAALQAKWILGTQSREIDRVVLALFLVLRTNIDDTDRVARSQRRTSVHMGEKKEEREAGARSSTL